MTVTRVQVNLGIPTEKEDAEHFKSISSSKFFDQFRFGSSQNNADVFEKWNELDLGKYDLVDDHEEGGESRSKNLG